MKMILTAGALCAALLLATIGAVHAKTANNPNGDSVTPPTLVGE